jgi:hypothetical protein
MYYYNLENRDAGGAAGVVNQLITQYPDELEPIYLGLKLSLLITRKNSYQSFRKMAIAKSMPGHIIELLDFVFDLLNHEHQDAINRINEIESEYPHLKYYTTALRYLAYDFAPDNEGRIKKAKKALIDSVDQFCLDELNRKK